MVEHSSLPRLLAIYLPQYHPIPENDAWWGRGFTDWINVAKARPQFPGHYQPHIPADLGFYDLRLPEVRDAQAELASQYGIHGFCYYHYWFNGTQLLGRPFQDVLQSGRPTLPFCLCWANENWSRRWDGLEEEVLLRQEYSAADDRAHIRALLPALSDPRYIRINGRRLLLIYRTGLLPAPERTAELWRETAWKEGSIELYLVRVQNNHDTVDPPTIGFDAAVDFSPNWSYPGKPILHRYKGRLLNHIGLLPHAYIRHRIHHYDTLVRNMLGRPVASYPHFPCVTPSWDNSPRRKHDATIFLGSDPKKYESWLTTALQRTIERFSGEERIVFINAWNEWAEGNHLEPDLKYGRAYLESTLQATNRAREHLVSEVKESCVSGVPERLGTRAST
jgi:lipopolysaccharide biosynthesis protein